MRKTMFALSTIALSVAFLGHGLGLRVNVSPSFPLGLYRQDPLGPFVIFCPEGEVSEQSLPYRAGAGSCADGGKPMLKEVVAGEGDVVEFSPRGISIDVSRTARLLPNTSPLAQDHTGKPLTHWPYGIYQVPRGKLVVVAMYSERSYDSRYYGPIEAGWVIAHLRPASRVEQFKMAKRSAF